MRGFLGGFLLVFVVGCGARDDSAVAGLGDSDLAQYVNAFAGTAENGHCFPGACMPFGLIQVGPETGNCRWEYCAGYQHRDSMLDGFSQNRLNGTGLPDLGDLLMLPFSGDASRAVYRSRFDKTSERAAPGYYGVRLSDDSIQAEMTATEHVALHRYVYDGVGPAHLLIDFQSGLVKDSAELERHVLASAVSEEGSMVTGFTRTKVWVDRTYYYAIEFSRPIVGRHVLPKRSVLEKADRIVYDFGMRPGEELLVKVALSATGVAGAKHNLAAELPGWDFGLVRAGARRVWNDYLSRIRIKGSDAQKAIFYTGMYHLFIQPNNIADAGSAPFYSTLSLWDTYRAAHPLYTILSPERVDGFVNSMIAVSGDYLPVWGLWGKETNCMIGNHAVPVIADAYLKGFRGFDTVKAYSAVRRSLTVAHFNAEWGIYDRSGYFPFDSIRTESVSKTLEFSYDDYCAGLLAGAMGRSDDAAFFLRRSGNFRHLFDSSLLLMRGKDSRGGWHVPFDPLALSHASTSGGDYTEGNAIQYTWHVQHDVPGLIDLMGGADVFVRRLDSLFMMEGKASGTGFVSDVTGLIGQYAHGNEPSHHVAYLYALAGKPSRTAEVLREIVRTMYRDKVDGLCGNDDCGQMSAWYIFSSLGFYPVNPCGGDYVLGAPQVAEAAIALPGGAVFRVVAEELSERNLHVKRVELNGRPYERPVIGHADIMKGGELRFFMGD